MTQFPYFTPNNTGERVTPPAPDLDYPTPPASCGQATITGDLLLVSCESFGGKITAPGNITAPTFVGNVSTTTGIVTTGIVTATSGFVGVLTSNNINVGVITATGGFISVANTTPIQISLVGTQLIFTAVGIGSTSFTLS